MLCTGTEILIEGLTLHCHVGVPKAERGTTQPILTDIRCRISLPVGEQDELESTVDYGVIVCAAAELVSKQHFVLLERLSEALAKLCFEQSRVSEVRIKLRKPHKLRDCEAVGVERVFFRYP